MILNKERGVSMKDNSKGWLLKKLLTVIGVFLGIILLMQIAGHINRLITGERLLRNFIPNVTMTVAYFGGYIIIVFTLRKIINSILQGNPFNVDNIIGFKRIGYWIFVVGAIDAIVNYPRPYQSIMNIMATSHGSIKPVIFLYMTLGCMALILADVFKRAMEIKDENDLTV